MSIANDRRYIRGQRCPICGGADSDARGAGRRCWGFLADDGLYAHCSREELAGPLTRSPSNTYGHRLAGSCACGNAHATPIAERAPRAVDIGEVVAEYNYHDESGVLLYQVQRHAPKTFRQRRPDGSGGWINKLDPPGGTKTRRVLYRLDRVIESDGIIWIVEGEKDVHAMELLGFVATCGPMGAGKFHMVVDCAKKHLKGRDVVVIADDDSGSKEPTKGIDHAKDVVKRLTGIASTIRLIEKTPRGHDAASWIEQGGTAEEFLAAIPPLPPPGPALQLGDPGGSYGLAVDFIARCATHPDGPTIRRWRGGWYTWMPDAGSYREITDERLETRIRDGLGLAEPKEVADVRKMAISVPSVAIDDVELGGWTTGAGSDDVVACPNGVLELATQRLTPVTPRMFTTAALGAAWDPTAARPAAWLAFLAQAFPGDQESIDVLQEWFGYHLIPDTRQQKIMFLVGLRRCGKGTIVRILNALIGEDNAATPTLDHLGTNFGLQPLIGKTAAIIGDARIDERTNMAALVSRLLGISGRDKQTIDRKRATAWTGYLSTRFTIACNSMPKFRDTSDALMGRILLLWFPVSFYGREDIHLERRLRGELPGILRWAIEGWQRLQQRGHFVQPASSAAMIDDMTDLANPVRGWLSDRCAIEPDGLIPCGVAYKDFVEWAEAGRVKPIPSRREFGIDLKATGVATRVSWRGTETHAYRGIKLEL